MTFQERVVVTMVGGFRIRFGLLEPVAVVTLGASADARPATLGV